MRSRKFLWLVLFFMLWLPLQGVAAAVLSVCAEEKSLNNHHDITSAMTQEDHHHAACHKQSTENPVDHVLFSIDCKDTFCDAYSSTPVITNHSTVMPTYRSTVVFILTSGVISFIPEQLQRPPSASFPL